MGQGHMRMEDLDFGKFRQVFKVKTNSLVFMQALPGCIPLSCITTFLSDYLSVEQGMKVEASTAITAFFGISCLCCGMTGGMIGNRLYNSDRDKVPLLMTAATCLAAIPFMMLVNSPQSAITTE